jgi:hypothetical protein
MFDVLKNIGSGMALSFNQEYTMECLWHEVNHSKQIVARIVRQTPEHTLMETANSWLSRRTYWQLSEKIPGWKPIHEELIKTNGYGYKEWVSRFDRLLAVLKVTDDQILTDMMGIHTGVSQDAWMQPVAELLARQSGWNATHILQALDNLSVDSKFKASIADARG